MMIIMGFLMIAMIAIMLPRASISAKRIADVLETKNSIVEPAHPEAFPDDQRGVVTFDHVSFAYPGSEENVLSDISFTAKPGQTTAFIGSTGSGKSAMPFSASSFSLVMRSCSFLALSVCPAFS